MSTLTHRIFQILRQNAMSADSLARRAGISLTNLERIMTEYSAPTPAVLSRIAQALKVEVDYLLGLTDNPFVTDMRYVPVVKKTRNGQDFTLDDVEDYIPMSINKEDGNDYFFVRSRDDGMIDVSIKKDDRVLIRQCSMVNEGAPALVSVNNRLAIIRRVYHDGPIIILVPENMDLSCEEQVYDVKKTRVKIIGQAILVIDNGYKKYL